MNAGDAEAATTAGASAIEVPAKRLPSVLGPLRLRNFRNLWLGQSISLIGDQFKFVALSWLVLSMTNRPGALGTVLLLQSIPRSILMLAGGVASDRLRPRTVMIASDLLRAFVVGTIALLVTTEQITMLHLYVLGLMFGVVHAFFFPAASAITPELVPKEWLRQANAVNQVTNQIVLVAAPALAGVAIAAVGTGVGFAVDAASFTISAVFLLLIRVPQQVVPRSGKSAWRDFVEGLEVVRRDRLLATMIGMASLFFFGYAGATYVGLPVLAKTLNSGPRGLGILFSASGLGALIGGILGGALSLRRRGLLGAIFIGAVGVLIALISQARSVWQAAPLLFVAGALLSWVGITFVTLIQSRAARTHMGRVMGMLMFGIYGLYPFSYGLAGWVSEAVGVRLLFVIGGTLIVGSALLGLVMRELRELD